GQLLVIPTEKIENRFFDLTKDFGHRPKRQKSFVFMARPQDDLKSHDFLESTKSKWISFTLSNEDKNKYAAADLLTLEGDNLAKDIVDWFHTHIESNYSIPPEVRKYFETKIINLLNV